MALSRAKLPRLNLARNHVTYLAISHVSDLEAETTGLLDDLLDGNNEPLSLPDSGTSDDGDEPTKILFMSFVKYRRSSTEHVIVESVSRRDREGSSDFQTRIVYDASGSFPKGSVPKGLSREGEMLARMMQIPGEHVLNCHGHLVIQAEDESQLVTVIPLPTRLAGGGLNLPFDEIRGIRGYKLSEGREDEVNYSFILDRPSNRTLYLTIDARLRVAIDENTPTAALDRVVTIANSLIVQGFERNT